jgi:hypothetical protein
MKPLREAREAERKRLAEAAMRRRAEEAEANLRWWRNFSIMLVVAAVVVALSMR